MTLIVKTALVGNYTTPTVGVAVNGIMYPGRWKGERMGSMPWFNGRLYDSKLHTGNCGHGLSVKWQDAGCPDALR